MLKVRRATHADAVDLAQRLREADLREIQAAGHSSAEESLLVGVNSPDPCYVAVDAEDTPHVIFGTHPSGDPLLGFIWMMASDQLKAHWVQVLRETRPWLDRMRGHYRVLANAVYAENTVHIRWLRWAGFTFLREFEFNGSRFYEFAKMIHHEDR
ncbi:TPA: hypothetical protein N2A14_002579 [Pseudomonas aeruginosa]|nr:hypothetical protein [Pseudomonas aeruginosa]